MIYDMCLKSDMLSTRKVKLHGMSDRRWTTRDKITQYKGLIKLYKREKKITLVDKYALHEVDKHHLCTLIKKNVLVSREKLDNLIFGDRQNVSNTLAEDRRLKLAYENLHPEEIMERIYQDNFNFRKELDLLYYKIQQKTNTLVILKLHVSELQDRVEYEGPGSLPIEVQCKIMTGHMQNVNLRMEAAIVINDAYKKINAVFRKDRIYFDSVLESLRTDRIKQGKCMFNTIILGQVAIEYLHDRKSEFKALEYRLKVAMEIWHKEVGEMREAVAVSSKQAKKLIRRDSDIVLPLKNINTNVDIHKELDSVRKILDNLRHTFYVNEYSDLYDCLKNQLHQKNRVEELQEKFDQNKECLQNKLKFAKAAYNHLHYTMIDTTRGYVATKMSLKEQIVEAEKRINERRRLCKKNCDIIVKIKTALQNLELTCKYVKEPGRVSYRLRANDSMYNDMLVKELLDIKPTCQQIIAVLVPKLESLKKSAGSDLSLRKRDVAQIGMETLVTTRSTTTLRAMKRITEGLLEDFMLDDPTVPTRADIKRQSKKIVIENMVNDDLIPIFEAKPRRRMKLK